MEILPNVLGIHEQALQVRSQRLEVLSKNIANADTPHYKARELDFKAVLGAVSDQSPMRATNGRHFSTTEAGGAPDGMKYRVPLNASVDGNTVDISIEQAQFGKAAADYRATLMFLENRNNTIKRALRGE